MLFKISIILSTTTDIQASQGWEVSAKSVMNNIIYEIYVRLDRVLNMD